MEHNSILENILVASALYLLHDQLDILIRKFYLISIFSNFRVQVLTIVLQMEVVFTVDLTVAFVWEHYMKDHRYLTPTTHRVANNHVTQLYIWVGTDNH